MNGLNWRALWDLEMIERERREARLERQRVKHEAGVMPARILAPLCLRLGEALIATGQRLASEPAGYRAQAPNAI